MQTHVGAIKIAANKANISVYKYMDYIESGYKRCSKCKEWKSIDSFNKDKSRIDGHEYICSSCNHTTYPDRRLKFKMKQIGLAFCSKCADWKNLSDVNRGCCITHRNEKNRIYYSTIGGDSIRSKVYARRRNTEPILPELRSKIMSFFKNRCAYCGDHAETIDHIIPVSRNGNANPHNLVAACRKCNSSKKDKRIIEWLGGMPIPIIIEDVLSFGGILYDA